MSRQSVKYKILFFVLAIAVLCFAGVSLQTVRARADVLLPSYIEVSYSGEAGLVGSLIDKECLLVQAFYEDGSAETVEDYYLSTERITKEGENEIAVVYRGRRTSFFVTGKRVTGLTAFYMGEDVSVGNAVSKQNIYAYADYSDGTGDTVEEFVIASPVITKVGTNNIYIVYGGKRAQIEVTGRVPGVVNSIQVTYTGGDVMLGSPIKREDIYVTALYADGTSETIENYQLSMETPSMIGVNTVIVTYRLRTDSFVVSEQYWPEISIYVL